MTVTGLVWDEKRVPRLGSDAADRGQSGFPVL